MKNMIMGWMVSMIVCSVGIGALAQIAEEWAQKERAWKEKAKDAYVFPVRPGMPEWAKLNTIHDMLAATQIPEDRLHAMSTAGLVETCLHYPLFGNIGFYDGFQGGFENVKADFNGLQELLRRPDAGIRLLAYYQTMQPERIASLPTIEERGNFHFQFLYIEVILAQQEILSSFPTNLIPVLMQESLRVFRVKQRYFDNYGTTLGCPVVILAKTLEQMKFPPFTQRLAKSSTSERYRRFLMHGDYLLDAELAEGIVSDAEQYLTTQDQGR